MDAASAQPSGGTVMSEAAPPPQSDQSSQVVENIPATLSYGGRYIQYNIFGNIFEVQKIVIKMQLHNDKRRSKAMQIASMVTGVISVTITGEGRDRVEVVGDGIDSAELTRAMRKKVSPHASLELVEEVKPKEEDKDKEDLIKFLQASYQYPPYNYIYEYNPSPSGCAIM